ncbi:MAG: NAD(P)H-hydrate dehydratase, partial [Eubacteriales bacterium]|nr:NAD(P)H-hydrate dehydratase [Eubacteriales bacterium]
PGLGNDFLNIGLIELVAKSDCRAIVCDADALNMIAKETLFETLRLAQGRSILTPHPGEAARLLGCSIAEIEEDREIAARKLAEKTGAVVVLKGNGTIVAAPDGEMRMNSTGNPGMATGGSGDVLSGIIASFCGQGLSCFSAACAGVYVHGMAGDLAAETFGEYGITAGDLPMMTALALKKILSNE